MMGLRLRREHAPAALAFGALATLASIALAAPPRAAAHRPAARPSHAQMVKKWHEAPQGAKAPRDAVGRPMLVLVSLNTGDRVELPADSDEGGFDAASLERASAVLHDPRTGLRHPIEPSLLDLVYRAQRRFDAPEIRMISGYRAPTGAKTSNHGRGRAMDLVVPGASDEAVAGWARDLGFAGVGIYPKSGFCHLDVRPQSHFWVDTSGPGQRSRERALPIARASKADGEAKRRNERGVAPFLLPSTDVGSAWGGAARDGSMATDVDDDHERE
jgi:uncharacterized protein YcbK (DUF882 family)